MPYDKRKHQRRHELRPSRPMRGTRFMKDKGRQLMPKYDLYYKIILTLQEELKKNKAALMFT